MTNVEIEQELNKLKDDKKSSHGSYAFFKTYLTNLNEQYTTYRKIQNNGNYEDYKECAKKYIESSKNNWDFNFMAQYNDIFNYAKGDVEKNTIELFCAKLNSLYDAMDKSGIISLILDKHNDKCEEGNATCLKINSQQVSDEFDFKRNSREKLPMLYLKNAFWLNKYRKILENLYIQENFENSVGKGIDTKEDLYYFLYMNFMKNDVLKKVFKNDVCSNPKDKIGLSICEEYGETYNEIFKDVFPSVKNDMIKDYIDYYEFNVALENISEKESALLNILLKNQMRELRAHELNPAIKQWGMFKKNEKIMMGLEPEGYMLPATFYIPQYIYSDVLSPLGMTKYTFPEFVPLDAVQNNVEFSDSVLVRPTLEQAKQIKLESKQAIGEKKEFLKRVSEQINGKPHLHTGSKNIEIEIGE